jgi:Helix-turn-helix domain
LTPFWTSSYKVTIIIVEDYKKMLRRESDKIIEKEKDVKPDTLGNDLIYGAAAIANYLGMKPRVVYHWLERGELPAQKLGAQWVCSRAKLRIRLGAG